MKSFIIFILKKQALFAIRRSRPIIIAITGSYGKTSAKDAIAGVLRELLPSGSVRSAQKSYNNEFGIPFTILGIKAAPGRNVLAWCLILLGGWFVEVPSVLLLEIGADHKGEIESWAKALRPHISIITGVSPVHVANYASYDELKKEKSYLGIYAQHLVLINGDDNDVCTMPVFSAQTVKYGSKKEYDYFYSIEQLHVRRHHEHKMDNVTQLSGLLHIQGTEHAITLKNATGYSAFVSSLIAFAVVRELRTLPLFPFAHIDDKKIVQAIEKTWKPTPGRMNPLRGNKDTIILDDSYNAAPTAVEYGLSVLRSFPSYGRKIAVLGRMAELGSLSQEIHARMGAWVYESSDYFIAVGEETLHAIEEAKRLGMSTDHIAWFEDSKTAGRYLDRFIEKDDIIYVKGSQSARMEFVVKDIFAYPETAEHVLVRQEMKWLI